MNETSAKSTHQQAQTPNTDPAHMAYLMGQLGRFEFRGTKANYPAPKIKPVRRAHNFSPEQKISFDFLKKIHQDLPEGFTAHELKKAFRKAALILHPDRGGTPEQFIALQTHNQTLSSLLP